MTPANVLIIILKFFFAIVLCFFDVNIQYVLGVKEYHGKTTMTNAPYLYTNSI